MEPTKRKQGRPPGKRFPRTLPVYDTEEGMALLQALAQQRGLSAAAVVRQLVREEARRIGLQLAPQSAATDEGQESQAAAEAASL